MWEEKRKFDKRYSDVVSLEETIVSEGSHPTDGEMRELFEKLSLTGTKPAILSFIALYSEKYIPKSSLDVFPKPLKSHHISSCLTMNY